MSPILKNVLAVLVGFMVSGMVNMGLVILGPVVVPPPPGADMTTAEGLVAAMPMLQPQHFVFPFLAHALGTLAGAFTASKLAASRAQVLAYVIGGFGLVGGIAAALMIPAPTWFVALDLIAAYLPMAWIGATLARISRREQSLGSKV